MQRIYLDNAATTPLDAEVLEAMMPYLTEKFGNPSSIYSYGRETKIAVEQARKVVANLLNSSPGEIFFTSGGTESTNMALQSAIHHLGCSTIITSPLEHHATLHTASALASLPQVNLEYVNLESHGHIDLLHLEELLANCKGQAVISLMHANNEIGNLLDIDAVGELAEKYKAIFHTDTVQTLGHYPLDLQALKVHFLNGAGHKFHGPKGTGIIYINQEVQVKPLLHGGSQERNMRAGTENVYGIVGFAKALELATLRYEEDRKYIQGLKDYMRSKLLEYIPGTKVNGDDTGQCLYTVLNIGFPKTDKTEMLLMNLDIAGVCVSGGSACSSGANNVSHVIQALKGDDAKELEPIRFSFSRHNTTQEIDQVVSLLQELM